MLASKSGVYLSEKEQVDIYVPSDSDTDVIVDYVDEGKRTTSLFDSSKLDTKDQYDVFLGGDFSVVDIKTVSTESKKTASDQGLFCRLLCAVFNTVLPGDRCGRSEIL